MTLASEAANTVCNYWLLYDTTHDDRVKVFHQNDYTCMMNITNAYIYTQWAIRFKLFQIANVQGL